MNSQRPWKTSLQRVEWNLKGMVCSNLQVAGRPEFKCSLSCLEHGEAVSPHLSAHYFPLLHQQYNQRTYPTYITYIGIIIGPTYLIFASDTALAHKAKDLQPLPCKSSQCRLQRLLRVSVWDSSKTKPDARPRLLEIYLKANSGI